MVAIFGLSVSPWILGLLVGGPAIAIGYKGFKTFQRYRAEREEISNAPSTYRTSYAQEKAVEKEEKKGKAEAQAAKKETTQKAKEAAAGKEAQGEESKDAKTVEKMVETEGKAEVQQAEAEIRASQAEEQATAAAAAVANIVQDVKEEAQNREQVESYEVQEDVQIEAATENLENSRNTAPEYFQTAYEEIKKLVEALSEHLHKEVSAEENNLEHQKNMIQRLGSSISHLKILASSLKTVLELIRTVEGKERKNLNAEVSRAKSLANKAARELKSANLSKEAKETKTALVKKAAAAVRAHEKTKAINASFRKTYSLLKEVIKKLKQDCNDLRKIEGQENRYKQHLKKREQGHGKKLPKLKSAQQKISQLPKKQPGFEKILIAFAKIMPTYFKIHIEMLQEDIELRAVDKEILTNNILAARKINVIFQELATLENTETTIGDAITAAAAEISAILSAIDEGQVSSSLTSTAQVVQKKQRSITNYKKGVLSNLRAAEQILERETAEVTVELDNIIQREKEHILQLQATQQQQQDVLGKMAHTAINMGIANSMIKEKVAEGLKNQVDAMNTNIEQELRKTG